jgi:alkylation response protein AidB-like acyl-CoA dehydrogenase
LSVARFAEAELLDRRLGDPSDARNPFGFAAALERDERGAFPSDFAWALRQTGFHINYLPRSYGGRLDGFDVTIALVHMAARRDLNVMPATMFSIAAVMSVLMQGSDDQKQLVARIVRDGGAIGFVLSEEPAGSDLLSNTCSLEQRGTQLVLNGEKWLTGLGARCEWLYVVARSGGRGPGAFSSVLLEQAALEAGSCRVGDLRQTTGMRGIDFTSYTFKDCTIPTSSIVGRPGQGLEGAMKAQQVVRLTSTAGNLACMDTALRVTLNFARTHMVAGVPLVDVPWARRELGAAAAAMMVCDVVALAAGRGIHVLAQSFNAWSAVAKRVVTELSAEVFARCADLLGARSVLRDGPLGIFQKMQRDNAIIRVIDASPVATLRIVAAQMPLLARAHAAHPPDQSEAWLSQIFRLDQQVPDFDPDKLDLTGRAWDPVSQAAVGTERARATEIAAGFTKLYSDVEALRVSKGRFAAGSPELLHIAERFCWLHSAAACLHLHCLNPDQSLFGERAGSIRWLDACLALLLARARDPQSSGAPDGVEVALEVLLDLSADQRLFSAVPLRLSTC